MFIDVITQLLFAATFEKITLGKKLEYLIKKTSQVFETCEA